MSAGRAEPPSPAVPTPPAPLDAVFAPIRSQTAFEEAVDRLGTAIELGLLAPGERLPAERELCARLGIARSTLRQATTALGQSGHLRAVRGRGGGTFVAAEPPGPAAAPPAPELLATWREVCDERFALEVGVTALAATRPRPGALDPLDALVVAMDDAVEDFAAYRAADVRFHIGLAQATGSTALAAAMTDLHGRVGELLGHIAHPAEVLAHANGQHARLLAALRAGGTAHATGLMAEHVQGTEHVLAGLLPRG